MTTATHTQADFERLRARVSGPLVFPGERGWDGARQAWNLAVDQQPAAVAHASGVEDVIAVVNFARERGMRVAAQGTGHGASTLELEHTILLKTLRMTGVEIDATDRRARVAAGTLWGEVAVLGAEHGLAGLAGSAASVGVIGYTLGGGLGWLSRRYGLACNSVRAVELVTAAGELVRTDREHEPDLFWALRGGGGGFGIVTAIEIDLYRTDDVFAGVLVWPADCAEVVLARYRDWTQTVPDTLSSIFRLLNAPPLPSVPEPIRGRAVVTLDAAYLGTERDGNELVRPLRQCAEPLLDTFQIMPASQVTHLHGDPESPIPGIGEGFLVDELSADAAGAFLSVGAPNTGSPLVSLELRHLGGRLAAGSPGHGALRSLDGSYALYGVGSPQNADHAVAIHAQLDAVERIMAPYACGRSYLNFADRRSDPAEAFDAAVYRRLQRVKAAYDPDDVIRSNHPIVPPDGQSDAGSVLSLR